MKSMLAALALVALPCTATAQTAPAPAPAAAAKFTLDTPIETIAADAAGKAVLDAHFPGMTTHAQFGMFKAMSLKQLQPMSGGQISADALAKAEVELAKIR